MIIPEEQAPIESEIKKVYNPNTLKQITRENNKVKDKQLAKN